MTIISAKNLVKDYDTFQAVKGISFDIEKTEIVAILGSNGAGKSSTIKMLCGLTKPTHGVLKLFDRPFDTHADFIRQRIGYVPEESALYEDLRVEDYLMFFASLYKVPSDIARARIRTHLQALDLKTDNKQIGQLSKGMKRKVLIIRSLIQDPDLLIYDEPASGLDPQTAQFILQFMLQLKEQGKTILFSSHNLRHVEKVATRVIVIHKGQKIFDGTPIELKKTVKPQYEATVLENGELVKKIVEIDQVKMLKGLVDVQPLQSLEDAFLTLIK
jgi:ABC-2 type transport system ATP-binding protein